MSQLIGKDPDAGNDWRQEEKGMTEDEMVGWHHRLDGREFGQVSGAGGGQGSLACSSPWGCRVEHDWETELNWGRPGVPQSMRSQRVKCNWTTWKWGRISWARSLIIMRSVVPMYAHNRLRSPSEYDGILRMKLNIPSILTLTKYKWY